MKKQKIKRFVRQRWKNIAAHTFAFCADNNPEELHKLRVEIKKLNLAFELLNFCAGEKNNAFSKPPLKQLFKQAGVIRTSHINLQLLAAYKIQNELLTTKQTTTAIAETVPFCDKKNFYIQQIKKRKKKYLHQIPKIKKQCITDFCEQSTTLLKDIFSKPLRPEELHESRKMLKKLLYLQAIVSKNTWRQFGLNVLYIDKLQNLIGEWHDSVVAIELISSIADGELLLADAKKQNEILFNSIAAQATNFNAQPITTGNE